MRSNFVRSCLAAVAAVVTSLGASAADMPVKARPYSAIADYSNWGGLYVGLSAGWATGSSSHISGPAFGNAPITNPYGLSGAIGDVPSFVELGGTSVAC